MDVRELKDEECFEAVKENADEDDICDIMCGQYKYCKDDLDEYQKCYYACEQFLLNK